MSILRTTERMFPLHPGELLREEFLVPLRLSSEQLATGLPVPASRVEESIAERGEIDAELALRLARYFGTSADFWMSMQSTYELSKVDDKVAAEILRIVRPAPVDEITGELIPPPESSNSYPSHA